MENIFTKENLEELQIAGKTHSKAHIRVKALALWNMAKGRPVCETADIFGVDRHTITSWKDRYLKDGLTGLEVKRGRGRPSEVDYEEVILVIHQSPRNFGFNQDRWTLSTLRQAAKSLGNLRSLRSVGYVLERLGLSPKRGQYRQISPDKGYEEKKTMFKSASKKR